MTDDKPSLRLASDWSEVTPRKTDFSLVYTRGPEVYHSTCDFSGEEFLGYAGFADCPFAVFNNGQVVFRYASQGRLGVSDFSAVAGFTPGQKKKAHTMFSLGANQWVYWLCEFVPGSPILCALLATDVPGDHVHIRHQLLFYNIETNESRRVNLCRDAFNPLAVDYVNREIMFAGGEGIHRVAFNGQRIETVTTEKFPVGRGAAYRPSGDELIIGGAGLYRWRRGSKELVQFTKLGQYPVWSPSGEGFYYSQSSGDICYFDAEREEPSEVVALENNERSEITFSRPLRLSQDGRYLAACLTRKFLPPVDIENDPLAKFGIKANFGRSQTDFKFEHVFVVLDLKNKVVWKRSGYNEHFAFMKT